MEQLELQGGACVVCKTTDGPGWVADSLGLVCEDCHALLYKFRNNQHSYMEVADYLRRVSIFEWGSWDRYFIEYAKLASTRSKDPSTQVGAVIVRDRNVLSTGYNGLPRGVNDKVRSRWERPEKYRWVVHAEKNAVLNAGRSGVLLKGSTMYTYPLPPCTDCAKSIIQSGIREVVVAETQLNTRWVGECGDAKLMLEAASVLVRGPQ